MTDDEIAEQYAEVNKCVYQNTFVDYSDDYEEIKQAVLYGLAEERKASKQCIELLQNEKAELAEDFCKQLAELKAETEKLKDCRNCDHLENNFCKQRKIFISNSIAQGCKYWKVYK